MNPLVMLSGYMMAFIFLVLWLWQKTTGAELVRRLANSVEQLKTELRYIVAERATLYERINRLECKREHFEAVAKAAQAEDRRAAAAAEVAERRRATEAEKAAARERERAEGARRLVWTKAFARAAYIAALAVLAGLGLPVGHPHGLLTSGP